MKTQQQAFDKWQKGVRAGGPNYLAGINNPKRDWSTATAAAVNAWEQGVQRAVTDGHYRRGVTKAGVDAKWKTNSIEKGAPHWTASVNTASVQAAYKAGLARLYTMLAAGEAAIAGHPRGDITANLERARLFALAVHNEAGKV